MSNDIKDNKPDEKEGLVSEISSEILGQPLKNLETNEIEISSDEDIVSDLSQDKRASKEAISGIRSAINVGKKNTDADLGVVSNDVDADWQNESTSEEVSMGENPTPDQDQVDSISSSWGMNYHNQEELDIEKKVKGLEQKRRNDDNTE